MEKNKIDNLEEQCEDLIKKDDYINNKEEIISTSDIGRFCDNRNYRKRCN